MSAVEAHRDGPWSRRAVAGTSAANAASAAVLALAYAASAGALDPDDQTTWAALAVGAVAVAACSNVWFLGRAHRMVRSRMSAVVGRIEPTPRSAGEAEPVHEDSRVAVVGGHRYHRSSCPLVVGKGHRRLRQREASRLARCEVCAP